MKLRSGFVSNSSTCSFSIYGIYLDMGIGELLESLKEKDLVDGDKVDSILKE